VVRIISLTIPSRKYRWFEKYRKIHEFQFRARGSAMCWTNDVVVMKG